LRESAIEKYLVRKVKDVNGLQVKLGSSFCKGLPDRLVLYKGVAYFVELKSKGGRLSDIQRYRIEKIRAQGVEVFIISSKEEVDLFVKRCLI
jgi:hypothetical protein